jgi:hypothetical protein
VLAPARAGTSLIVVDTEEFRVVRRIPLRSLVTDIDLDAKHGLVVAAQTGGIGERADRAVSIVDPRSGRLRYVVLDVPDPVNVVCKDGRAYVLHSVVTREGLVCSVLDVGRGTLIRTARVPDGPGIWASSRAGIWTVRADEHEWAALRLDTDTLDVSEVASSVVRVSGVAETATGTVLLGAMNAASGQSAAAFLGAGGAGEPPMALTGLRHPARMAARVGARLVIGDWAGQQPEPVSLSVVDAATLRHERAIRVPGAPCAFAAFGSHLLVVERTTGRLLEIDPASGATLRTLALDTGELLVSDIVAVPEIGR